MISSMYLSNSSAVDRIWHKVKFLKQSKASLNSEFSFFLTSYLNKANGSVCPTINQ